MSKSKSKKMYLSVFLSVICLFVVPETFAEERYPANPDIRNYTQSDYCAGRQNWTITQDRQGIMYFANENGLLEFDGARWQLHRLPGNHGVHTVAYDSLSQRVYSGAFEEFGYWKRNSFNDLEYRSISDSLTSFSLHNDEIWSIHLLNDTVVFHSFGAYFTYYQGKTRGERFPAMCLSMREINRKLYAATIAGLYVFNGNRFEIVSGGEQFTGGRQIAALLPFDKQNLLIATQTGGLYLYDGKLYKRLITAIDDLLTTGRVNRALITRDSVYIFGTIMDGVAAIDKQGHLLWSLNQSKGLQNNTVLGLYEDCENNVWLALDKGISCIVNNTPFSFYRGNSDNVEAVYSIREQGGALYLATNKGLFRRAGDETHFTIVSGTQGQAWDLSEWEGQLLCGHNEGTFRIEGKQAVPVSSVTGGYCLRRLPSGEGNVLIQSTYTHLVIYKQNSRGLWLFNHVIPDFIEPVRYLETDYLGYVWAGHLEKNIFRIRLNRTLTAMDEIVRYSMIGPHRAERIGVFKVNNRIVFTTGYELYTYDDMLDSVVPYDRLNRALGIFKTAHKIIPAENNRYWFACTDRLACITFDASGTAEILKQIPYDALNNQVMIYNESVYSNRQGLSFIGLNNGFALFDNLKKLLLVAPGAVLFRKIEAFNKKQQTLALEPAKQQTHLPSSFDNLRFTFAYPVFADDRVNLWYRLEGLEKEWLPAARNCEKEYSRLPAGEYTFKVKAADDSGAEISQISYSFVIQPPWYAGNTAYIGYGVAVLLLLAVLYHLSALRLKRKHQKILQIREKERQEELALQEQKITLLKNEKLEADVLYKAKELAGSTMAIIQKNNVLLNLRQELQKEDSAKNIKNIIKLINKNLSSEKDWEVFEANFDMIHDRFFRNLKKRSAQLTMHDLKLCAYLRLNLSTKEIAQLTGNTVRGVEVARYRLRKKLQLPPEQNLNAFMLEFKD